MFFRSVSYRSTLHYTIHLLRTASRLYTKTFTVQLFNDKKDTELQWLATHSTKPSRSLDYHHLLSHFGVLSVRNRLVQRDLTYLHSVFSGRINSAEILGMFGLCAPARRTRGRAILREPTARVETIRSGLFCRLPRHVNALYERVRDADLFSSRGTFWASVRTFLTL